MYFVLSMCMSSNPDSISKAESSRLSLKEHVIWLSPQVQLGLCPSDGDAACVRKGQNGNVMLAEVDA